MKERKDRDVDGDGAAAGTKTKSDKQDPALKEPGQSDLIAMYCIDMNGQIKWANKAVLEILGYNATVFVGRHISEFQINAKEYLDEVIYRPNSDASSKKYEIPLRTNDGAIQTMSFQAQPVFDASGKISAIVNICTATHWIQDYVEFPKNNLEFRDFAYKLEKKIEEKATELESKMEELKRSEERYHRMIEEVEDYAIILLDRNGIIRNWNKGAEKIKGYKEEEILGKSFTIFYQDEDRDKGLPETLMREAVEHGKALHEGWRVRKDGSRFWGSIVITALHNTMNEVIGFSKVTRDLTERKFAEERLKEYSSILEFQNRELEQFAYAASHDMKEPLRKIHFYNSYIWDNCNEQLNEKSREYLSRSLNAVRRMNNLIEDLLKYSKTTSNTENFEDVDLNEVVEEMILVHKDEFEQKKVTIEVNPLPIIRGIPFQMKQLFDNLVNNSIKYKHPDRHVLIKIKSELVRGSVREPEADGNSEYHKISVVDNGLGFEPQYVDRIFEIFQRLNNNSAIRGSGIGLAICKKIVQNHRGFIKAAGKVNRGAAFDIYLPID